jgi:hypothetical protein
MWVTSASDAAATQANKNPLVARVTTTVGAQRGAVAQLFSGDGSCVTT